MPDEGKTAACAICGKAHPISEMGEFCGKRICLRCLSAETFVCGCCRRRAARSEIAACDGKSTKICQGCFDTHFTRCDACGRLLRQPQAHWRAVGGYERPYCGGCFRRAQRGLRGRSGGRFQEG